jgi:hypothetical protein
MQRPTDWEVVQPPHRLPSNVEQGNIDPEIGEVAHDREEVENDP